MQTLPITYNKNGFTFNQISRDGDAVIYEQIMPEPGKRIAYEVFEVMKKKATIINGNAISARETPPSNEQWGNYGFTVYDLSDAKTKQAYIADRVRNRKFPPTVE